MLHGAQCQSVRSTTLSITALYPHQQADIRRVRDAALRAGVQRLLHQPDDRHVARPAAAATALHQRESTV